MLSDQKTMRNRWFAAALAAALIVIPQAMQATPNEANSAVTGQSLSSQKPYHDVRVTVANGVATLSGSVDVYFFKQEAAKKARKLAGVTSVQNQIEVASNVPDEKLMAKLGEELSTDRVGYWMGNTFNAISISVQNGVVVVGGHVRAPEDMDSAMGLIATTKGVKEITGKIEVDPVSPMDDHLRIRLARAIYGYAPLNHYAIDPAKPIRISVQNGHVTLYGSVSNAMDKQLAYIRANEVPGVFSVQNRLEVAR